MRLTFVATVIGLVVPAVYAQCSNECIAASVCGLTNLKCICAYIRSRPLIDFIDGCASNPAPCPEDAIRTHCESSRDDIDIDIKAPVLLPE